MCWDAVDKPGPPGAQVSSHWEARVRSDMRPCYRSTIYAGFWDSLQKQVNHNFLIFFHLGECIFPAMNFISFTSSTNKVTRKMSFCLSVALCAKHQDLPVNLTSGHVFGITSSMLLMSNRETIPLHKCHTIHKTIIPAWVRSAQSKVGALQADEKQ